MAYKNESPGLNSRVSALSIVVERYSLTLETELVRRASVDCTCPSEMYWSARQVATTKIFLFSIGLKLITKAQDNILSLIPAKRRRPSTG